MGAPIQSIGWTTWAHENAEYIRDRLGIPVSDAPRQGWRGKVIQTALYAWQKELSEGRELDKKSLRLYSQQYVENTWTDDKTTLKPVVLYMKPEIVDAMTAIGDWMASVKNVPFLHSPAGTRRKPGESAVAPNKKTLGYNKTMIVHIALEKYANWLRLNPEVK